MEATRRTAGGGGAVADLLPDHIAIEEDAPAPELPVTLDMPGKVTDFLRIAELEPAERAALDQGVTVRRGQGYTPARHRRPGRAQRAGIGRPTRYRPQSAARRSSSR
ncbi:hypothetical protein [Streptomyces sp. NPDC006307]|uniref:hypothetical protein n=1 Tax=Streptomyces sp. NPDC006307 TaxID=3156748 RepID=UPI0033B48DAA